MRARHRGRIAAERLMEKRRAEGKTSDGPRIIRTVDELEALDPDTVVIESDNPGDDVWTAQALMQAIRDGYGTSHDQPDGPFPAVVIRDGSDVRAALTALEKETNND